MKYRMSWTQKHGIEVMNQIYTAEHVTHKLQDLEREGATNIRIESFREED